jgi:tetratricopeptide (TPR) repeat protein
VGATARLRAWASAGHAIGDHPLLGSGPGRFRAATSAYRDLALVHAEGADRRFIDAHNLAVEYATTTGLLGVAALAAWLFAACRRARGPLLALGAAGRVDVVPLGRARAGATALLVVVALAAAGRLIFGDFELDQARLDFRASAARAAVRALPPWPEPADLASRVALYRSITTHAPDARREALRWSGAATRRDPTDPTAWSDLGEAQLYFGEAAPAERSFRRALRWDPWSVRALNGLANAALARGDRLGARRALQRSLLADPHQTNARRLANTPG